MCPSNIKTKTKKLKNNNKTTTLTWISKQCNANLNIHGYESVHIPENKRTNVRKGRISGGITVYYKTELKNDISVVKQYQN